MNSYLVNQLLLGTDDLTWCLLISLPFTHRPVQIEYFLLQHLSDGDCVTAYEWLRIGGVFGVISSGEKFVQPEQKRKTLIDRCVLSVMPLNCCDAMSAGGGKRLPK